MTKRRVLFVLVAFSTAIFGCLPKQIVWSPDGKRAILIAGGLYLWQTDGSLSAERYEGWTGGPWFPDSRRIVVVVPTKAHTWDEISPLLTQEQRNNLIALAQQLRREILSSDITYDQAISKLTEKLFDGEITAIKFYLREHLSEGLPEKLGSKWNDIKNSTAEIGQIQIAELTDENRWNPGPIVVKCLNPLVDIRISPDGRHIAYVEAMKTAGRLFVVRAEENAKAWHVADDVATHADWSADGRYLVYTQAYLHAQSPKNLMLGTLSRCRVCGDDGKLLEPLTPTAEILAGLLYSDFVSVRCLRDGRIVFSALEVQLPCTVADMPRHTSLFAVDPKKQPTVTRILSRAAESGLGDLKALGFFEFSPDETRICLGDGEGRTAIYTLATGEVRTLQPEPLPDAARICPSWRSNDELCFAVPPGSKWGSPNRAEIVLWSSPDTVRCISKDWPDSVIKDVLGSTKPPAPTATQPATQKAQP
jgi:hypothetical protein